MRLKRHLYLSSSPGNVSGIATEGIYDELEERSSTISNAGFMEFIEPNIW